MSYDNHYLITSTTINFIQGISYVYESQIETIKDHVIKVLKIEDTPEVMQTVRDAIKLYFSI